MDVTKKIMLKYKEEFFDSIMKIMDKGAEKHGDDSWLNKDAKACGMDKKTQVKCFASHAAEMYNGIKSDEESGEPPVSHIGCRSFMSFIRSKEGLDK